MYLVCLHATLRQSTHHISLHSKWQPSCLLCLATRTQTSMLFLQIRPFPTYWVEYWSKLLPPQGAIHHGCTWAIKNLKAGACLMLCLPMISKAARQTADKTCAKREYFIHSCQRKGGVRCWGMGGNLLQFRSWTPDIVSLPSEPLGGCLMRKHDQRSCWRLNWETRGDDIYNRHRSHLCLSRCTLDLFIHSFLLGQSSYNFLNVSTFTRHNPKSPLCSFYWFDAITF